MEPSELRRIARTISTVENQADGYEDVLAQAYRRPRAPQVIGITGPPGAGKSTLVDALTAHWAARGARIAILAVDPSSPYSGGAVLGDRIRRTRSAGYANTYFRSLASRGHVGGLSATAADLVAVLGLFEFGRVVIETVGAGQADVEIHESADCTVVMTVPGLGDGVQASKAGLMEIADVFAVNKADLAGADDAARMIERALAVAYRGEPGINPRRETKGATSASYPATAGLAALRRRHGTSGRTRRPGFRRCSGSWRPRTRAWRSWRRQSMLSSPGARTPAGAPHAAASGPMRRSCARSRRCCWRPMRASPARSELPAILGPWIERVAEGAASPLEAARACCASKRDEFAQRTGAWQSVLNAITSFIATH